MHCQAESTAHRVCPSSGARVPDLTASLTDQKSKVWRSLQPWSMSRLVLGLKQCLDLCQG